MAKRMECRDTTASILEQYEKQTKLRQAFRAKLKLVTNVDMVLLMFLLLYFFELFLVQTLLITSHYCISLYVLIMNHENRMYYLKMHVSYFCIIYL